MSYLSCRPYRRRQLFAFAREILTARGDGRAFAHVAWLAAAGLVVLLLDPLQLGWRIVPSLALFGALAFIGLFDARYFLIPDIPLALLFAAGLLTVLANDPGATSAHLLAAAGGYGFFFGVAFAYERLRGRAGLGRADFALFAAAGLWLGVEGLPTCLFVAVASALLSALAALRGKTLDDARQPIPFGPHLALGLWLVWAIGPLEAG